MNYQKIYEQLIARGKNRLLDEYTESHHIVPVCMGGDDFSDNLVRLTPEEHYVAHQLLVKIYPNNDALIRAAMKMTQGRSSNKLYGWLRRKFADAQSRSQTGEGNSQFGTKWIYNESTRKTKKLNVSDAIPSGWKSGRKISKWDTTKICKCCGNSFEFLCLEAYCSVECKEKNTNPFYGREKEFLTYYDTYKSMNRALKSMGFPGAISHWYKWARKILDSNVK